MRAASWATRTTGKGGHGQKGDINHFTQLSPVFRSVIPQKGCMSPIWGEETSQNDLRWLRSGRRSRPTGPLDGAGRDDPPRSTRPPPAAIQSTSPARPPAASQAGGSARPSRMGSWTCPSRRRRRPNRAGRPRPTAAAFKLGTTPCGWPRRVMGGPTTPVRVPAAPARLGPLLSRAGRCFHVKNTERAASRRTASRRAALMPGSRSMTMSRITGSDPL